MHVCVLYMRAGDSELQLVNNNGDGGFCGPSLAGETPVYLSTDPRGVRTAGNSYVTLFFNTKLEWRKGRVMIFVMLGNIPICMHA